MVQAGIPAPVKKGFLASIGDFFTKDIPDGLAVVKTDVVHALGVAGSAVAGGVGTFITVNEIQPIKAYLEAGNALNVPGIVTVAVVGLLSGLVTIASKSPNNVVKTIATQITPAEIQTIAAKAGADAGKLAASVQAAPTVPAVCPTCNQTVPPVKP